MDYNIKWNERIAYDTSKQIWSDYDRIKKEDYKEYLEREKKKEGNK